MNPTELREESRRHREEAKNEPDPHLRRAQARHAFALAQLAEKIEREEQARLGGDDAPGGGDHAMASLGGKAAQ